MRFSILVPVFKTKYLEQSINSILNQTYEDFELIIVNDKSPEDVWSLIKKFDDSRIKYYENAENLGSSNVVLNWNKCLDYAEGDFALLFSDDDYLATEFIAEIFWLIQKYPTVDLFYSRVGVVNSSNEILRFTPSAPEFETLMDFMWHRFSGYREMYAQNFVFRVKRLKEMGGFINFPLAWASDDATWFSLSAKNGVVSTNKILCYWRFSELNISSVGSVEKRLLAIDLYFRWLDDFLFKYESENNDQEFLYEALQQKKLVWKEKLKNSLVDNLFNNKGILSAGIVLLKIRKQNNFSYWFIVKKILKSSVK